MFEPIETSLAELRSMDLTKLKQKEVLWIFESEFPEAHISRRGNTLTIAIEEHIYTKFWWHKYHAIVFAEAMIKAVKRMAAEGHPFSKPSIQNDDEPHIFIRWLIKLPSTTATEKIIESITVAFDTVWGRANTILDGSESVLILGKDTGKSLVLLQKIKDELECLGYHVYLIKEQPDKLGEAIIHKVLRYALSSKFVIVENSEPSGHLYEIPHVTKMAECVTVILQQQGKGATWMFEDAYGKFRNWKKYEYPAKGLRSTVRVAVEWAEKFIKEFGASQGATLPWMVSK